MVQLDDVTHRYGDTTALRRVSLTVPEGEVVAVVGPPASGKSTLLQILAGDVRPTSGSVRHGATEAAAAAAAAVVVDDPDARAAFETPAAWRTHLVALRANASGVVLYATTDGDDAVAVADRIVVLRDGRLLQCGTPRDILERPSDEYVAAAFGHPRINLVPAILEKDGQAVQIGNQTVSLAGRIAEEFCRDVTVGVRPLQVRLQRESVGLRGRVVAATPGDDPDLVTVDVEGVRLRGVAAEMCEPGERIYVRILPHDYIVFDDRGVRLDQR